MSSKWIMPLIFLLSISVLFAGNITTYNGYIGKISGKYAWNYKGNDWTMVIKYNRESDDFSATSVNVTENVQRDFTITYNEKDNEVKGYYYTGSLVKGGIAWYDGPVLLFISKKQ